MTQRRSSDPAHIERTRKAYDIVAEDYADALNGRLASQPVERDALERFAQRVGAGGIVLDVGSGPGHVTAHLASLGLNVEGIELAPNMARVARDRYPALRFRIGSMDDLGGLCADGIVAWYAIIHLLPEDRPATFVGFRAALRAGGYLLLAFQVGDELRRITHGYGHDVVLDAWRLEPGTIMCELETAGFRLVEQVVREPIPPESVQQAIILMRAE